MAKSIYHDAICHELGPDLFHPLQFCSSPLRSEIDGLLIYDARRSIPSHVDLHLAFYQREYGHELYHFLQRQPAVYEGLLGQLSNSTDLRDRLAVYA
jgi:hypothetical protein